MIEQNILHMCCRHFGITPDVMIGRSRRASAVRPRHISMAAMHHAGLGMMEIARVFNRDHSCVSNALRKVTYLTTGRNIDEQMHVQVHTLTTGIKELMHIDREGGQLDGPGFAGLYCLPTYKLRLSEDETGWLHWMHMSRADVHKFGGGWVLNAREFHKAWKEGRNSIGSARLQQILERVQSSHSHVMIVPLALEVKCPSQTTLPALFSGAKDRTTNGNSSPTPSVAQ